MQFRSDIQRASQNTGGKQAGAIFALFAAACVLGVAIVSVGRGSDPTLVGLGLLGLVGIAGGALLALEIPFITLVRSAFVASFFFKGDMTLFKVDELEDPSGLNVSLVLVSGLCLLIYDHYFSDDDRSVLPGHALVTLAGLLLFTAASFAYSGFGPLGGFSVVSLATSVLVLYVTTSHFGRPDRLKELAIMIGAGLIFTGAVAFSQYVFSWPLNLSSFGTGTEEEQLGTQSILLARVPAFLRTPNGMALVVSSLVPIALAPVICRVRSLTSLQQMLCTAGGLAGIVAVILSLARGSWIGLAAAFALLLVCGLYRVTSRERTKYLASAAAIIVLSAAVIAPFADRIYNRLTEDDQGAAAVRIPLMETAWDMIAANPLLGVGPNSYRANMTRYDDTSTFVSQDFYNPVHNIFAHVTAEIGLPGGILFCLLIASAFVACVRTAGHRDAMVGAIAIGTAIGLVAFTISALKEPGSIGSARPPMRTLFFMLGIAFAIGRIRRVGSGTQVIK